MWNSQIFEIMKYTIFSQNTFVVTIIYVVINICTILEKITFRFLQIACNFRSFFRGLVFPIPPINFRTAYSNAIYFRRFVNILQLFYLIIIHNLITKSKTFANSSYHKIFVICIDIFVAKIDFYLYSNFDTNFWIVPFSIPYFQICQQQVKVPSWNIF